MNFLRKHKKKIVIGASATLGTLVAIKLIKAYAPMYYAIPKQTGNLKYY